MSHRRQMVEKVRRVRTLPLIVSRRAQSRVAPIVDVVDAGPGSGTPKGKPRHKVTPRQVSRARRVTGQASERANVASDEKARTATPARAAPLAPSPALRIRSPDRDASCVPKFDRCGRCYFDALWYWKTQSQN